MKRFNKFLALFLAVVMTVGLLPAAVSAATDPNVIYENNFESMTGELTNTTSLAAYNTFYAWPYFQKNTDNLSDIHTETDGNKCIKLNATANADVQSWRPEAYFVGLIFVGLNPASFKANNEYKVSVRLKADKTASPVTIDVYDAKSMTTISTQTFNTVGTDWTVVEHKFTIPAGLTDLGTMRFRVGPMLNTGDADAYLMVDDFCVSKVPAYDYAAMETELVAGKATLQGDVDGSGNDLLLKSGKTLDLAGYTLTVDSLSALGGAKVIDSVGGGKVVVAEGNLVLQADNGYLPIKVDGGYVFSEVKLINHELEEENIEDTLIYESRPSLGADNNAAYLADGAADNGLSIILRLTWTNASNGTTTTMDVPCSEELIKDIYAEGSAGAFRLNVTGVDSVENLKVATVITSNAGVTCVSEALAYTAPAV